MFLSTLGGCFVGRTAGDLRLKVSAPAVDKQDVSSEETVSAGSIFDLNASNRSIQSGLKSVKTPNKLTLVAQSLKNNTASHTEGSDQEELDKVEADINFPNEQIEKALLSGLKRHKIYSKSDWMNIIRNNDLENTSNTEMYASLRYGISNELRPQIWKFFANVERNQKEHPNNYYKELTKLKFEDGKLENQIKLDLGRTFPKNLFFLDKKFDGQTKLERILRAYALHDPTVGYVQGMNFIAASLLIVLHPINFTESKSRFFLKYNEEYEENVFWIFVHLMYEKNWRSIYKPEFPKVQEMCKHLEKLMQVHTKEIYDVIGDMGFSVFDLFHQAFISLMTSQVPMSLSKRMIDMFLIDGEKFIFNVLLRALTLCKKQIMEINGQMKLHEFVKGQMFIFLSKKYKEKLHVLFPCNEGGYY